MIPSASNNGRPPCGGVDRNQSSTMAVSPIRRRPPCGGVDRNSIRRPCNLHNGRSPPIRGRGSKLPDRRVRRAGRRVAPHAGAWIETWAGAGSRRRSRGRPPCGGVDRNLDATPSVAGGGGRPPCGGVDRNTTRSRAAYSINRRPPCGGVDRNVVVPAIAGDRTAGRPPCGAVGSIPTGSVLKFSLSQYGFRASGVRTTANADRAEAGHLPRFLSSVLNRPSQQLRRELASGERFSPVSAPGQSTVMP